MHPSNLLTSVFLLSPLVLAAGLYTEQSAVLQVDANNYNKLIAKSNYTSIVEFYAPWCGHCQNLKPAYEKAAASLSGFAKVAAVNCDEESNKQFCGSMGVQGFPTLKIVKPSKKGGRPVVEDYQGPRTAKGINDAVVDKILNHVTKVKDDGLESWLSAEPERPKAVLFTEKGNVSPLVKALAIDFLNAIDIAQIRSSEKKALEKYGVTSFPTLLLLPVGDKAPIKYDGDMKKTPLIEFLSQLAPPNPDAAPEKVEAKAKPAKKEKAKAKASSTKAKAPQASETLADSGIPTESPDANIAADAPPPVQLPVEPAAKIPSLEDEAALQKTCLHTKSTTCILAFLPAGANDEHHGVTSLSEIAHKHRQRGAKMFPFYAVPDTNTAGQSLLAALEFSPAADRFDVVAVNAKKGWWSRFEGEIISREAIETWVDGIRFGESSKGKLPEGLVKEIQEEVSEQPPVKAEKPGFVLEGEDQPIQIEIVELDDELDLEHDEL